MCANNNHNTLCEFMILDIFLGVILCYCGIEPIIKLLNVRSSYYLYNSKCSKVFAVVHLIEYFQIVLLVLLYFFVFPSLLKVIYLSVDICLFIYFGLH